eukprot:6073312-Amphidinium_carterae.1
MSAMGSCKFRCDVAERGFGPASNKNLCSAPSQTKGNLVVETLLACCGMDWLLGWVRGVFGYYGGGNLGTHVKDLVLTGRPVVQLMLNIESPGLSPSHQLLWQREAIAVLNFCLRL